MAVDTSAEGEFTLAVYQWLASVPAGKVVSYGQLARLAGFPRHARFVGRLMSHLPDDSRLPWWRVVTSDGRLICLSGDEQVTRLVEEGVAILNGKVSRQQFWEP